MITEADFENWTADDLRPYFDTVIGAFGFDRLMFGSDWPVNTLAGTYGRWVETVKAAVANASAEDQQKLFHDTAVRVYRL